MKQVNNVGKISLARNAEHFQFHHDSLDIITEEFAAEQKISALRTSYKALFDKEDEAFAISQTYADTATIVDKDNARDELTRYVFSVIDSKQLSPVAGEKEAAQRLYVKTSPYRGAHEKPYAENTALVTNMVSDMQSADFAADTAAIGLTDIVAQLQAANDDFNAVYRGRSSEKQSREQASNMKEIRPKVDTAFRTIAEVISALYCVNLYVTKDSATEAALLPVIDGLNAIILQLNETISRRTGGSSSSSSSTDDDSTSTDDNGGSSSTDDNGDSSDSDSSDSGSDSGSSSGDDDDVKF